METGGRFLRLVTASIFVSSVHAQIFAQTYVRDLTPYRIKKIDYFKDDETDVYEDNLNLMRHIMRERERGRERERTVAKHSDTICLLER